MKVDCWKNSFLNITFRDFHATDATLKVLAEPAPAQLACFIGPDMVRAAHHAQSFPCQFT